MRPDRGVGAYAIGLAVAFNVPYAWLAANFGYPDILRQPAGMILSQFHQGGTPLILVWWLFGLCAIAQSGLAVALLQGRERTTLALAAAMLGTLAGLTQAIGLWRWTFATPILAESWVTGDPALRPAIELQFSILHQFAGVAIGEHLGQWLTASWVIALSLTEYRIGELGKRTLWIGASAAFGIVLGALEGFTTVIQMSPGLLEWGAPVGYALFTVWLILLGVARLRSVREPAPVRPAETLTQRGE